MRKKVVISEEWEEKHCKSCLWLINGALCPFKRCPKVFGWVTNKNAQEGQKNGLYEKTN